MHFIEKLFAAFLSAFFAASATAQGDVDFAISEAYLQWLAESGIQPTLEIRHEHRAAKSLQEPATES